MAAVVRLFGAFGAIAGAICLALGAYSTLNFEGDNAMVYFSYGLGSLVTGASLYCFGLMADYLRSISAMQTRQASLLSDIAEHLKRRPM